MIIKAGATLPNGAIIVDYTRLGGPEESEGVVLAIRQDSTPDPYVTWRMDMKTGECFWGHYFHASSFHKAYADFIDRSKP